MGVKQKALRINLDGSIYGTFAEIGAGQDVAANFFKAGGASGTIAKTMSAYDMAFSDAIYGEETSGRYVSEARLITMLQKEYSLLPLRLENKIHEKRFFSFADTVTTLNFQKTNEAHGWMGIRFQTEPNSELNDLVLHIRMLDTDTLLQQQALGIVGVNLIYGCYFLKENPEQLLLSLKDDLNPGRIEIDAIRFSGPAFAKVDNRIMSLNLVQHGFTDAAVFGPDGQVKQPAEAFYKKHILAVRGRFRPLTKANLDLMNQGKKAFENETEVDDNLIVPLAELTLRNLSDDGTTIDPKDFLDRVDILCSMGQTVMISNFHEYYKLVGYLSKFSKKQMALVLGLPNLEYIFDENHYSGLRGGILEAFSALFGPNIKLYIYPTQSDTNGIETLENFAVTGCNSHLLKYLMDKGKIVAINNFDPSVLSIHNDEVLSKIKTGDTSWENDVPEKVAQLIMEKGLFLS